MIEKLKSIIFRSDKKESPGEIPKDLIKKILPDCPVIIEAGAYLGNDTVIMGKIWPRGVIHAFEPVPDIFGKLKKNSRRLKNIHLYPLALSNVTGESKMYVSSGGSDASSSLMIPKDHLIEHPDVFFENEIIIKTITVNDWVERYQIEKVDFLWFDMQGHELSVLKAAEKVLKSVNAIYIEVCLKEVYKGVPLYPEVRSWLEDKGFQVEWEGLCWSDMGNVLFVKG